MPVPSFARSRSVRVSSLLVVACLLVLSACAFDNPGGLATSGFAQDESSPTAIMVVGVRSLSQPENGQLSVAWLRFDPRSFRFDTTVEPPAVLRHDCRFGRVGVGDCLSDLTKAEYHAYVLEPGAYALHSVIADTSSTVFSQQEESLLNDNDLKKNIENKAIPWFTVNAGDVVYIGEYVFDIDDDPIRLVGVINNADEARKLRAQLTDVRGKMVYVGP